MDSKAEYVLGEIEPDRFGIALRTGFWRFYSPVGVEGLAKFDDDRLDVLALFSPRPGQGCFRAFINRAKLKYNTIYVWEIWTPWLDGVLERYGFKPATEFVNGERIDGRRWDREAKN